MGVVCLLALLVMSCSSTSSSQTTPESGPAIIDAGSAAHLQAIAQGNLASIQGLAWENDSSGVLFYSRNAVYQLQNQPGSLVNQILTAVPPEAITDISTVPGPTGQGLYVATRDITTFNLGDLTHNVMHTITAPGLISNVILSPDATQVAITRLDKIAVDLLSLPGGTLIKELTGFQTAAPVYGVSFSTDGKSLIWQSRAVVQLMDIATGQLGPRFEHKDFVSGLAMPANGGVLATGSGQTVTLWNPITGAQSGLLPQDGIVIDLDFMADGSLLAVATNQGVSIWDMASQQQVSTLSGSFRLVAFSPDHTSLAMLSQDGGVGIWRP